MPITKPKTGEGESPGIRILLAEDNPINQIIVTKVLSKIGYSADIASTGTRVLKAIETVFYDLILMDVHMPEMDGYEASKRIVEHYKDEKKKPLIVALTASISEHDMWKCEQAGMMDSLPKPFEATSFVSLLEKWSEYFLPVVTPN